MKELKLQFTIFVILLIGAFSLIIIQEKMNPFLATKVDEKLTSYINTNYKEIINEVNIDKTIYKDTLFQKKLSNKNNKNLNFTITYKNKKTSDNYQTNYIEGKEFLKYISNNINKDIKKNTNYKTKTTINKKYNEFNDKIKDRLLSEKDLLSLSIYNLDIELSIDIKDTYNSIVKVNNNLEKQNIKPNTYSFTIIDKNDITKYITIKNIKRDLINDKEFNNIIKDILNNNNSDIIKKNNIKFENNI